MSMEVFLLIMSLLLSMYLRKHTLTHTDKVWCRKTLISALLRVSFFWVKENSPQHFILKAKCFGSWRWAEECRQYQWRKKKNKKLQCSKLTVSRGSVQVTGTNTIFHLVQEQASELTPCVAWLPIRLAGTGLMCCRVGWDSPREARDDTINYIS